MTKMSPNPRKKPIPIRMRNDKKSPQAICLRRFLVLNKRSSVEDELEGSGTAQLAAEDSLKLGESAGASEEEMEIVDRLALFPVDGIPEGQVFGGEIP